MRTQKGFTLVELAIVLMIIGLLIGGILKGQELITNARVTSSIKQFRSYDAAVITFQDSYGALPGDITNPATRLPNCSAARCNTAGNGNGVVGDINTINGDENNAFWLHLGAAGLISGVDMSSTWVTGGWMAFAYPKDSFGNTAQIAAFNYAVSGTWPEGLYSHYYYPMGVSAGSIYEIVPFNIMARMDTKFDNGNPSTGIIRVAYCSPTNMTAGAMTYDMALSSSKCRYLIMAGF
jgi:prepilin-type N-terminal cleavage/methylation domain-containing protein